MNKFTHVCELEYFIWHEDKCPQKLINEWNEFSDDLLHGDYHTEYWEDVKREDQLFALNFGLKLLKKYNIDY